MDLICPSCEARYQIPDGSISEKGRQVSCMNCGHGWHAYPPLVLGTSDQAPSTSIDWQKQAAQNLRGAAAAAAPRFHADTAPPSVPEPPVAEGYNVGAAASSASRHEQLAEIREMLAEVQSEATDEPPAPEIREEPKRGLRADPAPAGTESAYEAKVDPGEIAPEEHATRDALLDESDDVDPLRRRMEMNGVKPAAVKKPDVRKLRRRHDRRERRRVSNRKAGSGAFLTGFLLIVIIAAVMVALYLLSPQIIERMPGTETAMNEYVTMIDGLRVSATETFRSVTDWVVDRSDKGG